MSDEDQPPLLSIYEPNSPAYHPLEQEKRYLKSFDSPSYTPTDHVQEKWLKDSYVKSLESPPYAPTSPKAECTLKPTPKYRYHVWFTFSYEAPEPCGDFDTFEMALENLERVKGSKRTMGYLYGGRTWEVSADRYTHEIVRTDKLTQRRMVSLTLSIEERETNKLAREFREDDDPLEHPQPKKRKVDKK
jgi:hypothetical protein